MTDQMTQPTDEESISDSRFNMWRAVAALAHADHVVVDEEKEFIRKFYKSVPFSVAQFSQLEDELVKPSHITDLFPNITNPEDRGEFIYFARMLFWCDGDFDAQEEAILDKLTERVINRVDLEGIMEEVQDHVEECRARREAEWKAEQAKARSLVGLGAYLDMIRNHFK